MWGPHPDQSVNGYRAIREHEEGVYVQFFK